MRNILLVIKREYLSRVRRKMFILTTLLTPLLFGVAMLLPVLLTQLSEEKHYHIVVKDESSLFKHKLESSGMMTFEFSEAPLQTLKQEYRAKGYDGILYIPDLNIYQPKGVRYLSDNQISLEVQTRIEHLLSSEVKREKLQRLELDESIMEALQVSVAVETSLLGGKMGEQEQVVSAGLSTAMGFIVGILLYMVLLIYGTIVMRGVIEEKTNRIVEVIISSVRPFQLMMGKIIGVASVGLTQFGVWILLLVMVQVGLTVYLGADMETLRGMAEQEAQAGINPQAAKISNMLVALQHMNIPLLILCFFFYFLGGFFLYASLFAAVGSAVDDEGDVQTLTIPVTIPVIISFFVMMASVRAPHGDLAFWASMVPFSSPLVMPARIPFGVPGWELALSMLLLVAGFVASTWVAGRVYRVGILMYGKKPALRELGRWFFRET